MKVGDAFNIEGGRYSVEWAARGCILLKRARPAIGRAEFEKGLRSRHWRRPSESATFLVNRKTGATIGNAEMLALRIPSKRIERLHANLPMAEGPR